jgi:hypothetical protein
LARPRTLPFLIAITKVSIAVDVTAILTRLLAANRGPHATDPDTRPTPDYGVAASLAADVLSVVLTFKRDRTYCCMEWGCHLGLFDGKRWNRLRQKFAEADMVAPARLRLVLTCQIEAGSLFFDLSKPDRSRRGWYAFAPAAAYEYQVTTVGSGDDSNSIVLGD